MPEVKAVQFKNFTKEDFTYPWDSIPYTFKAGQTMFLEDWKAEHFAQHLVDRELNNTNTSLENQVARKEIYDQCFPKDEEPVAVEEILDKNAKATKKTKKVEKEDEFADLDK